MGFVGVHYEVDLENEANEVELEIEIDDEGNISEEKYDDWCEEGILTKPRGSCVVRKI